MKGKKDDDDKKVKCPACNGQGGEWSVPNGSGFKKRSWITCKLCKGKKYV